MILFDQEKIQKDLNLEIEKRTRWIEDLIQSNLKLDNDAMSARVRCGSNLQGVTSAVMDDVIRDCDFQKLVNSEAISFLSNEIRNIKSELVRHRIKIILSQKPLPWWKTLFESMA